MKKRLLAGLLAFSLMMSLPVAAATEGTQPSEEAAPAVETLEGAPQEGESLDVATPETAVPDSEAEPVAFASAVTLTETVEGITVTASAEAGVLPEGVIMRVTPLEQDAERTAVADTLGEHQVEYEGFLALDVSFFDGENKIEPQDGSVQVSFALDAALLPDDADPDTLAVQHLVENENGDVTQVETVADTDTASEVAGTVEIVEAGENEAVVAAEFEVESFSTFTLTWNYNYSNGLTITCIDEQGNEIGSNSTGNINTATAPEEIALAIAGYTFDRAVVASNANVAITVTASSVTYLRYNSRWQYSTSGQGNGYQRIGNNKVYFIYKAVTTIDPDPDPDITRELSHTKTVTLRDDGSTYDLNLTVSGAVGSIENPVPVDVIFVLDISTSMKRVMEGNDETNTWTRQRMYFATNAIKTLTESLQSNTAIDARYSLVTFGTYGTVSRSWTDSSSTLNNALPTSVTSGQGTNYEDGLLKAENLLNTARTNATTVIVFVSDGDPSYYNRTTGGVGGSGSAYDSTAMEHAQIVVSRMQPNYFYTVGVGPRTNYEKLEYLTNPQKDSGSPAYGKGINISNSVTVANYSGTDENALKQAFADIETQLTKILCTNVTITDVLSDNVEIVTDANGQPEALTLQITDSDGNIVGSGPSVTVGATDTNYEVTLTPVYDSQTKTIQLACGADYKLEAGWTYTVTAHIKPSETAYQQYWNDSQYPDTPDEGTGTHADRSENGFYSNKGAKVTYTFNGQNATAEYDDPVVQLSDAVSLTITKVFEGLSGDDLEKAANAVRFEVKQGNTIVASDITLSQNEDGTYTATVNNLQPGKVYTVTETNNGASVLNDRFTVTTTWGNSSESSESYTTAVAEQSASVTVKNTYVSTTKTLTISKTITGNMGDTTKRFAFTLTVPADTTVPTPENSDLVKVSESTEPGKDQYTFTLTNADSIAITLPNGTEYTVTEDSEGYTATYKVNVGNSESGATYSGTLTADTTIAYTNTKQIVTPTGVNANAAPYLVMVGVALAAGAWLLVRRRRELE